MFKKIKKAYTLIEMMVVMGIIAVILLLGAGGMMGANNDNVTEETAQGILSLVREAQTKAISVSRGSATNGTKVWAVSIPALPSSTGATTSDLLGYWSPDSTHLNNSYIQTSFTPRAGVSLAFQKIKSDMTYEQATWNQTYVTYSTPFARNRITLNNTFLGTSTTSCYWGVSNRPEKDWEIQSCADPANTINGSSDIGIRVKVSYKNSFRWVYIMANGDAYVKSN